MARNTPTVQDGKLTWPDGNGESSITVGTPEWQAWLSNAKTFRFVSADGTFTARKECFRRGGWYWRAYLHRADRIHHAYLGKRDALTHDRLRVIAASLAVRTAGDTGPISLVDLGCQGSSSGPLLAPSADNLLQLESSSLPQSMMGRNPLDLLFATKLSPPPGRPDLVMRTRLLTLLSRGLNRQLTLIMAPAGSGKTTLLSQWVLGSKHPFAWVSLDGSDKDPARFWTYLIASLQTLHPHLGERALSLLRSSQTSMESVLEVLIGDLSSVQEELVLVLDDYHVVESQPVHDTISFFLEHLPRCVHVVIATRCDPSLPVARLRVRGQLTEVRAGDLSFTRSEATSFFNEVMSLDLSAEHVEVLKTHTEGWIAGLQLAALSLQGCDDVSSFVQAFAGDHRYVMDYLMEEVFANQSPSTQTFLLHTSILDRLSGPVCNAVAGVHNGRQILESLERANLFTVPFDGRRLWYRYHHLFSEFLQSVLHRQHSEQIAQLHLRASNWYAENGVISKAVDHALAAGEPELAAQFIEQDVMPMLRRGELTTFKSWMIQLPEEVIRSRPRLCVYYAWALTYSPELDAAEKWVREIECLLANDGNNGMADSLRLRNEVMAVRAILAARRGDHTLTIALSNQALEVLPEDNPIRAGITLNLVLAYRLSGDIALASRQLSDGSTDRQADGTFRGAGVSLSELADLQAIQGRLRQAASTYGLASEMCGRDGLPSIFAKGKYFVGMGRLLYEWNDLGAARRYVTKGIELGTEPNVAFLAVEGQLVLARLKQAQGDLQGALDATTQAELLAGSTPYVRLIPSPAEYRARLWLMQGRLDAVAEWAESAGLHVGDELNCRRESEHITLARLMLAQGRPGEAVGSLRLLRQRAESQGRTGRVIKILALEAVALDAAGNVDGAFETLARALSLAEREGYIRTFVDLGAPMAELLTKLLVAHRRRKIVASRPISATYVTRLIAAFGVEAGWHSSEYPRVPGTQREGQKLEVSEQKEKEAAPLATASPAVKYGPPIVSQPLIEPLSEREHEVLYLLAAGASNQEIAQQIVVTVGTVKMHVHNVYGKLGVHSRTLAIVRASEMGLLS